MGRTIREPRVTHQRQARRPVTATRSPWWLSSADADTLWRRAFELAFPGALVVQERGYVEKRRL